MVIDIDLNFFGTTTIPVLNEHLHILYNFDLQLEYETHKKNHIQVPFN